MPAPAAPYRADPVFFGALKIRVCKIQKYINEHPIHEKKSVIKK
jgi:hypothetical protein